MNPSPRAAYSQPSSHARPTSTDLPLGQITSQTPLAHPAPSGDMHSSQHADHLRHKISWRRSRTRVFARKESNPLHLSPIRDGISTADANYDMVPNQREKGPGPDRRQRPSEVLPLYNQNGERVNHNGHKVTPGIQPDGESGRHYFHPLKFLIICWRSSCAASKWTNILWPFTIAAMVLYFHYPHLSLWVFLTAYVGMIPAANLVGFAGQELARKIPKVAGVLLETTFGSVVEIILFMILLVKGREANVAVIRAAILGSILANMLLCLGLCFFVGGIFHPQQTFHEAISEVGSNLMLVAGFALIIPTVYYNTLFDRLGGVEAEYQGLKISRACAIILLAAFVFYVFFQARSHHGLYEDILEADEERDHDRHKDLTKEKLTMSECVVALLIALTFVSFMSFILVHEIHYMVAERGISEAFLGLILVPLVEKTAEHITAVDEAYDNQMNFALSHVLGASIQTALLNTPLVVLVGWGLSIDMSLNFELFDAVIIILAIIVVGNFLRDEKSDYLEGALCVFVYTLVAVTAYYYPNPLTEGAAASAEGGGPSENSSAETAHRMMMRL